MATTPVGRHQAAGRTGRRRVLQGGAAGAGGLAAAWLAACGGDSKEPSGQTQTGAAAPTVVTAPAEGTPKRGGIMNWAESAALAPLDPFNSASRASQVISAHSYSKLLKFKTGPTPEDSYDL